MYQGLVQAAQVAVLHAGLTAVRQEREVVREAGTFYDVIDYWFLAYYQDNGGATALTLAGNVQASTRGLLWLTNTSNA